MSSPSRDEAGISLISSFDSVPSNHQVAFLEVSILTKLFHTTTTMATPSAPSAVSDLPTFKPFLPSCHTVMPHVIQPGVSVPPARKSDQIVKPYDVD
jgi:hypothetical protein